MDKKLLALLLALVFILPHAMPYATDEAHGRLVIVIVLDAYNPVVGSNVTILDDLIAGHGYSVPLEVQYPATTIVSHMAFVTGMLPNVTNIANTYMIDPNKLRSDRTNAQDAVISRSDVLNTTTLYGLAAEEGYLTALVTAKSKLLALLGPEGQATVVKQYTGKIDRSSVDSLMAANEWLMNETKAIVASRIDKIASGERGYLLVNLLGTDYIGHSYGPSSDEYMQVLIQEETLVKDFITRLMSTSVRDRTLVIVCGDHSMVDVTTNAASEDTVTHMLIFPELAVAGITHVAMASSGNGVFIYLLNNDTQTIQEAVSVLRQSGKVDGIRTSVSVDGANGTLYDIGLNTPYAGDIFVSVKPPYYFYDHKVEGAHGGYSTKVTKARVFTGRTDVLKSVDKLTSIDIAALSFGFLGINPPEHSLAKVSKVLDERVMSSVSANLPPFVTAGSSFDVLVNYALPQGIEGSVKVSVYDSAGYEVFTKSVSVSGEGVVKVSISGLNAGAYKIVVSLLVDNEEVAGKVYTVSVQEAIETNVSQPVGKMAVALVLFVLIVIGSIFLAKRIQ